MENKQITITRTLENEIIIELQYNSMEENLNIENNNK